MGIFNAADTVIASDTLSATIVYDATGTTIAFAPATVTVHATGGDPPVYLAYTSETGYTVKPIAPADGTLACGNGFAAKTQLRAGPPEQGVIQEQYVVLTASLTPQPAAGTSLSCTSVWGLYDSANTLIAEAPIAVTIVY